MLVFMVLVSGCLSPSSGENTLTSSPIVSSEVLPSGNNVDESVFLETPGEDRVVCNQSSPYAIEECFEEAFATCQRVSGVFWKTSDGAPLLFESQGPSDDAGTFCVVRVSVFSDSLSETAFAGQSARCLVPISPPSDPLSSIMKFDVYSIGPETCTGSYVDAIQKTLSTSPFPSPTSTPNATPFSIVVNDSGVVGEKSFTVSKGTLVELTVMVSSSGASFGGETVRAPAGSKLANDSDYLFTTGHLSPGQSKTVTFVAEESFEFGGFWPGSNVLKGKGKFIVE